MVSFKITADVFGLFSEDWRHEPAIDKAYEAICEEMVLAEQRINQILKSLSGDVELNIVVE